MIYINIAKEIYENEKFFNDLDDLFRLLMCGRHKWDIKNEYEFIFDSEWYKDSGNGRHKRDFNKFFQQYSQNNDRIPKNKKKSKFIFHINIDSKDDFKNNIFSPKSAYDRLKHPFKIIVENEDSDRSFLNFILKMYKPRVELDNDDLIEIEGAGGRGEILKRVRKNIRKNFENQVYVIFDSDKKYPDDNGNYKHIESELQKLNVNYWILKKREIENYIPDNLLKSYIGSDLQLNSIYDSYCKLQNIQKDFFDMKTGFNNKENTLRRKSIIPNKNDSSDEAYLDYLLKIDEEFFNELRGKGFGDKIYQALDINYRDENLTKNNFEKRVVDSSSENEVLNKVNEMAELL